LKELLAQRVFSIACGYPDANDAARLGRRSDSQDAPGPRSGRGPRSGFAADAVAFRNAIGVKELYRLGEALAASVLQRHAERLRGRVRRVTSIWIRPTIPLTGRSSCRLQPSLR